MLNNKPDSIPWETLVDVRKGERMSDTILAVLSDAFKFSMKLSMDPLKFEQRAEFIERDAERARRLQLRRRVRQSFRALEKAEFIAEQDGTYRLTLKGWMRYAWNYSRTMKKLKKPRKTGKKMLIVVFDIPEALKRFRESLRRTLYNLGFSQLQKSVFVGYDARAFDFIARVLAQTELHDRVKLIVGERIL